MVAREICGSSAEDLKLKTASSELIAKHVTVFISSYQRHSIGRLLDNSLLDLNDKHGMKNGIALCTILRSFTRNFSLIITSVQEIILEGETQLLNSSWKCESYFRCLSRSYSQNTNGTVLEKQA
jgi:hypothetical protein